MSAPTDLELMLYHDGELDEPRRAEVEAWLGQNDVGRAKLAGLAAVGVVVRERAMAPAEEFDVAAAVMKAVVADGEALPPKEERDAKVVELPKKRPADAAPPPANDSGGRLVLWLTGIAAAAAVALFVWGRSAPAPEVAVVPTGAPPGTVESLPSVAKTVETPPKPVTPSPSVDHSGEIEVASVDFGSRSGAVYYVGGADGPTTAVVWVTDD